MSVSDHVDTFLAITGSEDATTARNFLEMSGNNLEAAISLYFEHGPSIGVQSTNTTLDPTPTAQSYQDDDAALAARLQQETYQEEQQQQEARAPDQPVHERLVGQEFPPDPFGAFAFQGGNNGNLMFGGGRSGVFNQREESYQYNQSSEDDDDRIEELDSDGEPIETVETHQQKLARLFRPPFDLIDKIDLDTAKLKARKFKKWILINIQDDADFQCQVLNRDFWSSLTIKGLVRREFVFLQYHKDSRSGGSYSQFYQIEGYPHIAILDPITGERVKTWTGVPVVKKWYREVEDFLSSFSLEKGSVNPIVQSERPEEIDPTTLTEEQQLEYAIKQSIANSATSHSGKIDDPIDLDEDEDIDEVEVTEKLPELTEEEKVKAITPSDTPEPEGNSALITRIQIRAGNGTRVVRKFNIDDKVLEIYRFVKGSFEQVKGDVFFTLTSQRENLMSKVDETIADAGLKNSSILLEVIEDEDEAEE